MFLVEATSDNNRIKVIVCRVINEIMSLRLAEEMIFSLRVRSRAKCVDFYMIPYI
jgi:hypothetical protein